VADEVLVEAADGIAVITINRPQARNAVNKAVATQIAGALDDLDARPDVNALVITGAGGTFSAGMDLKAFAAGEVPTAEGRGFGGITERPPAKPVVAAVEGYALAGGFELALACDLVVASEEATFGLPEVTRGLVAGAGGLLRLPRRIPPAIAYELALTGDPLTAEVAHRHGLVNQLVPEGGALDGALALAARITPNGPLALTATKQILDFATEHNVEEGWAYQAPLLGPVFTSNDAREGAIAFAEKRAPKWTGT
jgi:enoyl-CoA hydratase